MKFAKPEKTNGFQLKDELAKVGIVINDIWDDGDGFLSIEIDEKFESKALEVTAKHIGIDPVEKLNSQRSAILEKLGITAEEAKLLLS